MRSDDQASWQLVDQGEPLPGACQLRSAGAGLRLVDLSGATLQVEGGSTLHIDAPRRQITLLAGRIGVAGVSGKPWQVSAGEVTARIVADSRSVWSLVAGGPIQVHSLAGKLEFQTLDAAARVANAAPTSLTFDAVKKAFATRPLAQADQDSLAQTFHDRPAPQGLGQLVVEDSQSGTAQRLEIAQYHVNVVLQPPVALVQIDQSFYNPFPRQMEGTFVFNLPAGAAVSRFAMYVTREQLIEGELIERQRANQVYTTIVNSRRDPAILEDIGNNLFRMRVFPIFAQDTKRILLDYTLPLEPTGNQYRFRLPLFSDLKPIWDFSVTGQIHGDAMFDSFACPTHPQLEIRREKDQATWKWTERDYKPQSDLLLSFRGKDEQAVTLRTQFAEPLSPTASIAANSKVVRDPRSTRETTYFMLTVPPSLAGAEHKNPAAADVLLLVDTSQFAQDRATYLEHARTVLRHLRPEDRLRVAVVDVNHRWLHADWLRAGSPESEQVLARLAEQYPLGPSLPTRTIAAAVEEVFGAAEPKDTANGNAKARRRQVLWLAEGWEDGVGNLRNPVDVNALAPKLRDAKVSFTAIVASNRLQSVQLAAGRLEALANATGGRVFDARTSTEQAQLLEWLLAGLPATSSIESLSVDGALDEELLYSKAWRPGRPLRIYGRADRPKQLGLKLTIRRDSRKFEHRQTLDVTNENVLFVGRTWAQRRIAEWRDANQVEPAVNEELRRRIIGVSQEWSVLSPHTAFLVLETEQDYARWNIDRSLRRKYWKPQGTAPTQELSAEWLARIMKDQKSARNETRLAANLASAQEQLTKGNFARAYWELADLDSIAQGDQRLELERLRRLAEVGLARESSRRQIPLEFPIFAPRSSRAALKPSWSRYVLPDDDVPTDLTGSRFAKQLSKVVSIAAVQAKSLRELADWVELTTGVQVDFDRKALESSGTGLESEAPVLGFGEISIGSYLAFAMKRLDLRILEEPDRLLVTSAEDYENHLSTELYPLEDLLLSDGVASLRQLRFSSAEARRRAVATRLRAKLQEPLSLELLEGTKFRDALQHVADKLGAPVVLDARAIEGATIGTDHPIERMRIRGLPAGLALRRLLKGLELTYAVHNEAILVTTREEANRLADVRVYAGRELVHMEPVLPQELVDYRTQPPTIQRGWWPNGIWPRGGTYGGPARGMGGMGGFGGMGGGMGGFGGGLGGMAGGTFGSGGALGGSTPANIDRGGASPPDLSSGGDGSDRAPTSQVTPASGDAKATAAAAEAPTLPAAAKPPKLAANPLPILDFVQETTAKPEPGWVQDGGIGTIDFFDPTFDFVVRTTDEAHDQIASLLDRLAKLPKAGITPANAKVTAPRIGRDELNLIDYSSIAYLIQDTIGRPDPGWIDDGGVNNLEVDAARLALVVSAVPSSHEELHTLLTLFRRSRYEAKFGRRPWELDDVQPFGDVAAIDSTTSTRSAAKVSADELNRLAVRRVPKAGNWQWNRSELGGRPRSLTLALADGRLEFAAPNQVVRVVGRDVAEAHTDLGSVVLHRDLDAVLRQLDMALPWWPHRSNEELASLYVVDEVPAESTAKEAVLRLTPRALVDQGAIPIRKPTSRDGKTRPSAAGAANEKVLAAIENPVAFFKAGFDRSTGQLVRFVIHFDGKLVGRLAFARPAGGKSDQPNVTLLDDTGRTIVAWSADEMPAAVGVIAAVDAGWSKFAVLDRRAAKPAIDPDYHAIVTAMSQSDWRAAYERLQTVVKSRSDQPLLRMLRGVCALNDASQASRAQAIDDLAQAAASSASGIALALATQPQFEQRLTPEELAAILARQPEAQRPTEVWLRLARLAHGQGDAKTALQHARKAWALTVEQHGSTADLLESLAQRRLLITLLLAEKQVDEARRLADEFLTRADASTEQTLLMAEIFAQQNQPAQALAILESQLATKKLDSADRYQLTRRAADYAEGFAKLQLLFDSLRIPGQRDSARTAEIELLATSLPIADDAAKLVAQAATDPALRGRLLYAQALLTSNVAESGKLYVQALELAPIPRGMEEAVTKRLIDAELYAACVAWFEGELRAGRPFDRALNARFAWSLKKVGREREAARVMP